MGWPASSLSVTDNETAVREPACSIQIKLRLCSGGTSSSVSVEASLDSRSEDMEDGRGTESELLDRGLDNLRRGWTVSKVVMNS